jgi:CheY-like chemotaxis protein
MSLVGNLEDLGLGEILQIVSLSRKSGLLMIRTVDHVARIVFSRGQVVNAVSTAFHVDLSEILTARGVVDHASIEFARSLQEDEGFARLLGDILIAERMIGERMLEELVRELVEKVVYSLFAWEEGTFDFELEDELEQFDDIRTNPVQYVLKQGLNAQFLAMEGARLIDEQRHGAGAAPDAVTDENLDLAFDLMQETVPPVKAELPPELSSNGRSLVLVDDDELFRTSVSTLLSEEGYSMHSYASGEDALIAIDTLCRSGDTPLTVVDLVMPRMDGSGLMGGLELLELVHENFPHIRVVVLADAHYDDAEKRLSEMGYPLVFKPNSRDFANPSVFRPFADRLLNRLSRIGSQDVATSGDTVNIGDELRLEMGEETDYNRSPLVQSTGISLLRSMLEELSNPSLGGGITLLVLRFASEFVSRAVIFTVKDQEIAGLGQFGLEDREQPADARVRAMRIPLAEKTLFTTVVESQLPVKLQLDDSCWSRYLREQLGGNSREAFIGPIVSEGKVVALLYGDNGGTGEPLGDTDSLEIFLSQAGMAMEKVLLQRRLKEQHPEGS